MAHIRFVRLSKDLHLTAMSPLLDARLSAPKTRALFATSGIRRLLIVNSRHFSTLK